MRKFLNRLKKIVLLREKNTSLVNQIKGYTEKLEFVLDKIDTVSKNVDFANGLLVEQQSRFLTVMGPERFKSLKPNKDNFIIFSYPQAVSHPTADKICLNIGDYVQSIAVKNAISKVLKNVNFKYFDRDNLLNYYQENGSDVCIMQGFFPSRLDWLPNKYIYPVFIGFHLGGAMEYTQKTNGSERIFYKFHKIFPWYFKDKDIGCRDRRTEAFVRSIGINAYFSRCLSLTLPRREKLKSQNKIFVSCFSYVLKPLNIFLSTKSLENIEYVSPEVNVKSFTKEGYEKLDSIDFMLTCKTYLEKFKNEAKLVITDRIHIAGPCLAMGIPTIVIKRTENDPRYDIFDGIVKCHTLDEVIKNGLDLSVEAVDIEDLKKMMLKNLELSVKKEVFHNLTAEEDMYLEELRSKINNFSIKNEN